MDKIWKSLRVDRKTHQRVKVLAAQLGMSHADAINMVLDEYDRSTAQGRRFKGETNVRRLDNDPRAS